METPMMIMNDKNSGNFDLQQLINLNGQIAMNVNGISKQMGIIVSSVDTLRSDIVI